MASKDFSIPKFNEIRGFPYLLPLNEIVYKLVDQIIGNQNLTASDKQRPHASESPLLFFISHRKGTIHAIDV
jgi:hypothetical protein